MCGVDCLDRSKRCAAALRQSCRRYERLYTRAEHECASHDAASRVVLLQGSLVAVIRGKLALPALALGLCAINESDEATNVPAPHMLDQVESRAAVRADGRFLRSRVVGALCGLF